jgi:chlorobactene glucosyltransferase
VSSSWYYLLLGLCLFSAAVSTLVLWRFAVAMRRIRWRHLPADGPVVRARLSVIIPARNEEQDIGAALRSVLGQAGVDLEILVVNDHSTDRTGIIANAAALADPRLAVIHNPELRPGWLGKANAMQHGAARATGQYLLFTDADVLHAPDCFRTTVAELEQRGIDFISLFPTVHCVSLWENVLLPLFVAGIAHFAGDAAEDTGSPDALAAGALMLIRADVFRAVGGFEAIKGEMLDDVSLARLVKKHGYRVGFRAAPSLLQVRLFKGNRHAFWGTTKNILAVLHGRLWLAPLVMLLPLLVFWAPPAAAVIGALAAEPLLVFAGLATYAFQYVTLLPARRVFVFHRGRVLFFPLIAIVVLCCVVRAWYYYGMHGTVLWRDRAVRVRGGTASELGASHERK